MIKVDVSYRKRIEDKNVKFKESLLYSCFDPTLSISKAESYLKEQDENFDYNQIESIKTKVEYSFINFSNNTNLSWYEVTVKGLNCDDKIETHKCLVQEENDREASDLVEIKYNEELSDVRVVSTKETKIVHVDGE